MANPDNVGGVFRNAAAFGATGVLLDAVTADPLYRKAIRTSMGASLVVPFARVDSWLEAIADLRARGFATVAMTPQAGSAPVREVARAAASRPAVVLLGHEGDGLAPAVVEACEYRARIPIAPLVDSLNVSAAAAVALYEFGPQE